LFSANKLILESKILLISEYVIVKPSQRPAKKPGSYSITPAEEQDVIESIRNKSKTIENIFL
jgi:hypothetical protein